MRHDTLVLGLEHFIDKIGYQAHEYARRGIPVKYLVSDITGFSRQKAEHYNTDVEIVPTGQIARLAKAVAVFMKYKPRWCELYDTGRLTLAYALIAKLFRSRLVIILRGQEFRRRGFRAFGLRTALRLCDHIVSKEANLSSSLSALAIRAEKITELSNCVPLPDQYMPDETGKDIDVLFLNSVRAERHVDLLLMAIRRLKAKIPDVRVVITGFSTLDDNRHQVDSAYEKRILAMIDELGLQEHVQTFGFVRNPSDFYTRAKVFVLPAEVVFLNYSLLEAMSYAVAPVVCNGEGAEKIIEHDQNGKIVDFDDKALADAFAELLEEKIYGRFGEAARQTVRKHHSMTVWGDRMLAIRKRLAGAGR